MKRILAPTDFSDTARNAVEYAVSLALQANAELILFHAYHASPLAVDVPLDNITLEEIHARSDQSLQAIRREILHRHGDTLTVECVSRCGFAVDEIADFALEYDADLVVMGMQGAGYISETVIGSITTALLREAPCPVLVIDRHVKFADIRRIVLACDYVQPPRREALDALKDFAGLFTSPWVYVVNVVGKNAVLVSSLESRNRPRVSACLNHEGHSFHSVEDTDVVAGLKRFAQEKQADLVVMVPRRYSFWRGIFYAPLIKRMAFHTSVPLLVLQS